MALQIEYLPTDALLPYARNAKIHTEGQIAAIAASIKEFGFTSPILVSDENTIIAGHARWLAAQKLKLETVPCVRLSSLSPAQIKAYTLADNRLAEIKSAWDDEMLRVELEDLQAESFDLSLTGFDLLFLEDLISDKQKLNADFVPEEKESTMQKQALKTTSKEIALDEIQFSHKCPRCGFEFNDD